MTLGQRSKAVEAILAPPRGLSENLAKLLRLQREGNPFIKNVMLKLDMLDVNGTNNTASKLCELAAQRDLSLTLF
jgi:hypothetical protein